MISQMIKTTLSVTKFDLALSTGHFQMFSKALHFTQLSPPETPDSTLLSYESGKIPTRGLAIGQGRAIQPKNTMFERHVLQPITSPRHPGAGLLLQIHFSIRHSASSAFLTLRDILTTQTHRVVN